MVLDITVLFTALSVLCLLYLMFAWGNSLHNIIIGECLWIVLFLLTLATGFGTNNLSLLALSLFILTLSALEFGMGMLLLMTTRDEAQVEPLRSRGATTPRNTLNRLFL